MNRQLLVILAAFVSASLAQVQVNTPSSVQSCLPVQLTWSGGKAPYFLGLIAGGQPSSPILKDFGQQTGNSYTWSTDAPAGTSYTVQIRDSDGQINYSDQFTVQPSSQTCTTSVGGGSTSNSTGSTTSTGTTASTTATGKNSSSTSAASSPSTNSTGKASGSSSSYPTTSSSPVTSSSNTASTASTNSSANAAKTGDSTRLASGFLGVAVGLSAAIFA